MDIRSTSSNWKYPTSGHILPIRAMEYTGTVNSISHVTMADPHYAYYTANYRETASRAYTVNHAHPQYAMVF
jgi:D-tyrosyl-tRNA(Tyr) deacylase